MITEETIVYNKNTHNKNEYSVQAFVIDGEVVDVFATPKTFSELCNTCDFVEKELKNQRYKIDVVKNGVVIEELSVNEKLGAILLSSPLLVELSSEKNNYLVVPGMKYVDGLTWSN
jgi:hypothetical protein